MSQRKIIVYNIPRHQAVDFIEGRNHFFVGDTILARKNFLSNFHLEPSRISLGATRRDSLASLYCRYPYFIFASITIAIIKDPVSGPQSEGKLKLDYIIISQNPRVSIADIAKIFACKKIVFDASNSTGRISKWKKECAALNLSCYSVPEKGAFVMSLN